MQTQCIRRSQQRRSNYDDVDDNTNADEVVTIMMITFTLAI